MKLEQHIHHLLLKVGLTESEAKLYMAAQKYPKATLAYLQQKTGYSTATVYRSFEHLKELGFLFSSSEHWRKNIEAAPLKVLAEKLAKEKRRLTKIEQELKTASGLFQAGLESLLEDPVEIFTNESIIKDKYFELLNKPWNKATGYGSPERLNEVVGGNEERQFVDIRIKKGKKCDVVYTEEGPYTRELLQVEESKSLRNEKVNKQTAYQNFMAYLCDNQVTLIHNDEKTGKRLLVIKDPAMVQMHQNIFQSLWNTAGRFSQKEEKR